MTQDEEAFIQYKSHQAHGREQEAKGKREKTTEGFMRRKHREEKREVFQAIKSPRNTQSSGRSTRPGDAEIKAVL